MLYLLFRLSYFSIQSTLKSWKTVFLFVLLGHVQAYCLAGVTRFNTNSREMDVCSQNDSAMCKLHVFPLMKDICSRRGSWLLSDLSAIQIIDVASSLKPLWPLFPLRQCQGETMERETLVRVFPTCPLVLLLAAGTMEMAQPGHSFVHYWGLAVTQ